MSLKIRYNAPVSLTFSLVCIGVFFLCELIPNLRENFFVLYGDWQWANPMYYLRLFTYTLGHANKEHLMGNISLFLLLAPTMEEKYGSRDILAMIGVTAFVTAVFQILLFDTGLLGASGVLFMFIILTSFADARKGSIPLTFILVLVFYIGKELVGAWNNDMVSQYAHIAGGLIGGFFGFALESGKMKQQQ
jgi:membrane associated rhomboid family serine protease